MRSRSLLVLIVIVVALGAFIFFSERHMPTTEERRQQADRVFPALERDEVETLAIHNSHGSFRLIRDSGAWRLVEPIEAAADDTAVSSLLGSLERLDVVRTLPAGEVDPSAYGLDDPALGVTVGTGSGELELAIGDETALGSNRAMRRDDDAEIILAAGWIVSDLDKPLDDWRSHDVVDISANDVASLQVVADGDRVQVVREDDRWRLLEPVEDVADADHVRNLIGDLDALRVVEFLDDPPPLAELGLEEPATRVTVVRSEGGEPIRLDFGASRTTEGGATEVAARRNGTDVFWVNDRAATRLAKAPVRWRATKVADFDTWDAERLTISAGGQSVTLERSDGMWRAPEGGEVDHAAVQDRLAAIAGLEAIEFDLLEPAVAPAGTVELALADGDEGTETLTLTFYRPLSAGGDALVRSSERPTVMSVAAAEVDTILADPAALVQPSEPADSGDGEG